MVRGKAAGLVAAEVVAGAGAAGDDEEGKRLEEEGRGGRWHGVGRGLNGPEGTRGKGRPR